MNQEFYFRLKYATRYPDSYLIRIRIFENNNINGGNLTYGGTDLYFSRAKYNGGNLTYEATDLYFSRAKYNLLRFYKFFARIK